MKSNDGKRKVLADVTNIESPKVSQNKKPNNLVCDMMPIISGPDHQPVLAIQSSLFLQKIHPGLAMFKHDLKTDKMSFEDLQHLCGYNNESELIKFLTDLGVLAPSQQCLLCGYNMRQQHEANETREHYVLDLHTQSQWGKMQEWQILNPERNLFRQL